MILKNVKIVKMDLAAKENRYAGAKRFGIRHFIVVNEESNSTFIRISDNLDPEKLERILSEIEKFQVGDFVDVDIEPVKWRINDQSGTSYIYRAMRSNVDAR